MRVSPLKRIEVADGFNLVNGRPHGFNYVPRWEITLNFDTLEEAEQFMASLSKPESEDK